MCALGLAAGAGGSLVDSLLGATLQASWFDPEKRCIVPVPRDDAGRAKYERVCGVDALTNEQVNAVSVAATTLASAALGDWLLA